MNEPAGDQPVPVNINKYKRFKSALIYGLYLFLVFELTLRVQQRLGPIYDLELEHINMDLVSDVLNHFPGRPHDKNGIILDPLNEGLETLEKIPKILFMGDSFMEGLDNGHSIPAYIRNYFKLLEPESGPVLFLNAGSGSYSPSIFIPQAKLLIPLLKPDIVVIDVDSTDLGDDAFRYKKLTVRGEDGKIAAVSRSPRYDAFVRGFVDIKKQPLYTARMILKIWHTRVRMPGLVKETEGGAGQQLSISPEPEEEARLKYEAEIKYFTNNLDELFSTVAALTGDRSRLLVIYHPHLQHLKKTKPVVIGTI